MKALKPKTALLVAGAFRIDATGEYSIRELRALLYDRGLANRARRILSSTAISTLFRNPFYAGTIRIRKTGTEY